MRERSPGSETRGAETQDALPGRDQQLLPRSETQVMLYREQYAQNADSEKAFLLGLSRTCLNGEGICEGHLTQERKEVLNKTVGILLWRNNPGQKLT